MLSHEKARMKNVWSLNCEQLRLLDEECGRYINECTEKDNEIKRLKTRVRELERNASRPYTLASPRVETSRGPPDPELLPTPIITHDSPTRRIRFGDVPDYSPGQGMIVTPASGNACSMQCTDCCGAEEVGHNIN